MQADLTKYICGLCIENPCINAFSSLFEFHFIVEQSLSLIAVTVYLRVLTGSHKYNSESLNEIPLTRKPNRSR
jgi:hypothetical protein